MPLAYSYLRFSTPEQSKGDSFRRQTEAARTYAERHGLHLDDKLTFRDLGVSAFRGANAVEGALGQFIAAVDSGRVPRGSFLLVENLDRLSRERIMPALDQFRSLLGKGIKIVTLSDGKEYNEESLNNVQDLILSLFVMSRAHEESKLKSERVGAAWKQKQDSAGSKKVTARCPGWLKLDDKRTKFEKIDERVAGVKLVFEYTAKGIGRQKIAAMLNTKGIPSPGGTRWYAPSISRLLKSDAVLGTYQPHEVRDGKRIRRGEPVPNYYPQVVTANLVRKARAAMAEGRGDDPGHFPQAGRKGFGLTNLFGGIVFCNECNSPMRLKNRAKKRGDHAFLCSNRVESANEPEARRCQHRRQYQYESFERDFLDFIEEFNLSVFDSGREHASKMLDEEIATMERECKAKRAQLDRLFDAFGDGDNLTAKKRIDELDVEVRELEHRLAGLQERKTREQATTKKAEEHKLTISRLQKRMQQAEGDERYTIRSQLAQEIRRVVKFIWFGSSYLVEGGKKADCYVWLDVASADVTRDPNYYLRMVKEGRRVKWECYRSPTQAEIMKRAREFPRDSKPDTKEVAEAKARIELLPVPKTPSLVF